jgi:hypothetical protein
MDPRYKYLIPASSGAREIDIVFEMKYAPKSNGNAVNTYYTHPAFTFGNEELNGIWVGKFETTGAMSAPIIKPDTNNVPSESIYIIHFFIKAFVQGNSAYGFINDNDTHMMKNTEWGAVSYLSHSIYGKYGNSNYDSNHKEIYMNNSVSKYTGRSMGAPGGGGIQTTVYYGGSNYREFNSEGYYTYDGKCAIIHTALPAPCNSGSVGQVLTDKTLAYGASTTGNIYGIYDMSGGSVEYVMGMYKPNPIVSPTGIIDRSGFSSVTSDSQFDLLTIDSKYYNQYLTNSAATGAILGDATNETVGWYGDDTGFAFSYNGFPWFCRSGIPLGGTYTGIFSYSATSGSDGTYSFRIVLSPNS